LRLSLLSIFAGSGLQEDCLSGGRLAMFKHYTEHRKEVESSLSASWC